MQHPKIITNGWIQGQWRNIYKTNISPKGCTTLRELDKLYKKGNRKPRSYKRIERMRTLITIRQKWFPEEEEPEELESVATTLMHAKRRIALYERQMLLQGQSPTVRSKN